MQCKAQISINGHYVEVEYDFQPREPENNIGEEFSPYSAWYEGADVLPILDEEEVLDRVIEAHQQSIKESQEEIF